MRKCLAISAVLLLILFAVACDQGEDQVPAAPTNLEATVYPSSPPNVILDWDEPADGVIADRYNVYRDTLADFSTKILVNVHELTATAFMDTTVTAGTTYFYQVRGVNADGESIPMTVGPVRP